MPKPHQRTRSTKRRLVRLPGGSPATHFAKKRTKTSRCLKCGRFIFGVPSRSGKPKIPDFNVPLILDLMEGLYLAEKEIITVYEGLEKRKVSLKKLRQKVKQLYEEFDEKYAVYHDLRDSGLIVTPGIKFGCDFAVYKHGPGVEHAPYMVSVKSAKAEITATEIVKAGRLATTVRKRFIIAVPDLEKEKIRYLMFKWFKA